MILRVESGDHRRGAGFAERPQVVAHGRQGLVEVFVLDLGAVALLPGDVLQAVAEQPGLLVLGLQELRGLVLAIAQGLRALAEFAAGGDRLGQERLGVVDARQAPQQRAEGQVGLRGERSARAGFEDGPVGAFGGAEVAFVLFEQLRARELLLQVRGACRRRRGLGILLGGNHRGGEQQRGPEWVLLGHRRHRTGLAHRPRRRVVESRSRTRQGRFRVLAPPAWSSSTASR